MIIDRTNKTIMKECSVARGAPKGDEFVWGVGAAIVTLLIIL